MWVTAYGVTQELYRSLEMFIHWLNWANYKCIPMKFDSELQIPINCGHSLRNDQRLCIFASEWSETGWSKWWPILITVSGKNWVDREQQQARRKRKSHENARRVGNRFCWLGWQCEFTQTRLSSAADKKRGTENEFTMFSFSFHEIYFIFIYFFDFNVYLILRHYSAPLCRPSLAGAKFSPRFCLLNIFILFVSLRHRAIATS